MAEQELHERIEAYLQQQMSPDQATAFEAAVATDPALAEEVALQQISNRAGVRLAEISLQKKLAQWRTEADLEEVEPSAPSLQTNPWLTIALIILLLAAAFGFWKFGQKMPVDTVQPALMQPVTLDTPITSKQPIAALPDSPAMPPSDKDQSLLTFAEHGLDSYMNKYAGDITRGRGGTESPEDAILEQADSLLKIKKYTNAVNLLEKIGTVKNFQSSALKRLAFAHYKLKGYDLAIETYKQYASLTPANEEEHNWILCLYLLADYSQQKKPLREILNKMVQDPEHQYYKQAVELNRKLH